MRLLKCALLALLPIIVLADDSSSSPTTSTSSTSSSTNSASSTTANGSTSITATISTSIASSSTNSNASSGASSTTSSTTGSPSTGSTATTSSTYSSTSSNDLPTLSMPKISTSGSTSSFSATFTPGIPNTSLHNPHVYSTNLPSGLAFIAVGSAIGLLLTVFLLMLCIKSVLSRKNAKYTSLNQDPDTFDYESDIFRDLKSNSAVSVYSKGSNNTSLDYLHGNTSIYSIDQIAGGNQGGRSYRNAVNRASRASMFISPTAMLSMQQLGNQNGMDWANSPIESPETSYDGSVTDFKCSQSRKQSRPPSVLMDKLFQDSDSLNSSSSSAFDSPAHEKV